MVVGCSFCLHELVIDCCSSVLRDLCVYGSPWFHCVPGVGVREGRRSVDLVKCFELVFVFALVASMNQVSNR